MAPSPSGYGSKSSPRSSRASSLSQTSGQQHRPTNPSGLRQSHMPPPSPDDRRDEIRDGRGPEYFVVNGIHPETDGASVGSDLSATRQQGAIEEPEPNARTALLNEANKYDIPTNHTHNGEEIGSPDHLSPRPRLVRGYGSFATQSEFSQDGYGGRYPEGLGDGVGQSGDNAHGVLGDAVTDGLMGPRDGNKMSTTQWLARRHGIKNSRIMYVGQVLEPSGLALTHRTSQSLTPKVGTCSTIFPRRTGFGSTAGHSCKVILSLH